MGVEEFARLYERYHGRVFAYIYARVREPQLAEDLTADTFVQAFAKAHTLRDPQAGLPWLLAIARNMVAAYYRRRAREERGLHSLWEEVMAHPEDDPATGAERQEIHHLLAREVARLSPREQEVLRLRFEAGLRGGEIARLLGVQEVMVRVIIFRALAKLRRALATYASAGSR